jgi:hypothetical protein
MRRLGVLRGRDDPPHASTEASAAGRSVDAAEPLVSPFAGASMAASRGPWCPSPRSRSRAAVLTAALATTTARGWTARDRMRLDRRGHDGTRRCTEIPSSHAHVCARCSESGLALPRCSTVTQAVLRVGCEGTTDSSEGHAVLQDELEAERVADARATKVCLGPRRGFESSPAQVASSDDSIALPRYALIRPQPRRHRGSPMDPRQPDTKRETCRRPWKPRGFRGSAGQAP